jgi:hypothetical protein
MAQQFQKDARVLGTNVTIIAAQETEAVRTASLPMPFGNGKFSVQALLAIVTSADAAVVQVRIRRNPSQENAQVGSTLNLAVGFTAIVNICIGVVDAVPDGRDCQYVVTVQEVAAAANGVITAGAYIEATGLSG